MKRLKVISPIILLVFLIATISAGCSYKTMRKKKPVIDNRSRGEKMVSGILESLRKKLRGEDKKHPVQQGLSPRERLHQ